jgi:hypothetical protein
MICVTGADRADEVSRILAAEGERVVTLGSIAARSGSEEQVRPRGRLAL